MVGVLDDGTPVGVEADKFENDDKMLLHLDNLIKDRIGPQHLLNIRPRFDSYQDKRVLVVDCKRGASTTELTVSQAQEFIKQRFV